MSGVRWRTLGKRVSWFTGRRWQWSGARDEYQRPAFVVFRRYDGQVTTVKAGLFGVALFWDRLGHHLPPRGER